MLLSKHDGYKRQVLTEPIMQLVLEERYIGESTLISYTPKELVRYLIQNLVHIIMIQLNQ